VLDFSYIATPFLAWLTAGGLKFFINSMRAKRFAFDLIGYGGLPSNHSAIVCSMTTLIALKEGVTHPAFGVALTITFIVMLDAISLRRQVGEHAAALNRMRGFQEKNKPLRERMGHSQWEIAAGALVGAVVATVIFLAMSHEMA